jgi:uncharacterized membrane protein
VEVLSGKSVMEVMEGNIGSHREIIETYLVGGLEHVFFPDRQGHTLGIIVVNVNG